MVMLKFRKPLQKKSSWNKISPGATEHTIFVADMEKETFEKGFEGHL